jgi:hypothetical protein
VLHWFTVTILQITRTKNLLKFNKGYMCKHEKHKYVEKKQRAGMSFVFEKKEKNMCPVSVQKK